jgi:hypothetical protein
MTDSALNYYLASGTNAARLAFTPSPPTPAAGPNNLYIWYETDTGDTYGYHGGTWSKVNTGGGSGASYSVPVPSSFTWVNQGTSTATQTTSGGSVLMEMSPVTSIQNWRGLFTNAPSTPYKVKAQVAMVIGSTGASIAGIYFHDGIKFYGIEWLNAGGAYALRVEKITNATTDGSTAFSIGGVPMDGMWFQLRNSGTTLYFDLSYDGVNFTNFFSEAVGTYMTPTKIGYGGFAQNNGVSKAWWLNWTTVANANLN